MATTTGTSATSSTRSSTRPSRPSTPDEQAALFNQAEEMLLNEDIGVIPINWYLGDYAYNDEKISNFPQTKLGIVLWEQLTLSA